MLSMPRRPLPVLLQNHLVKGAFILQLAVADAEAHGLVQALGSGQAFGIDPQGCRVEARASERMEAVEEEGAAQTFAPPVANGAQFAYPALPAAHALILRVVYAAQAETRDHARLIFHLGKP